MCGILGAVRRNAGKPYFSREQLGSLAHRGPDGEGLFTDEHATLGNRRLAVIDLTDQTNQPMTSDDDRFVVTYNGEIYNYIEIREQLRSSGHTFSTQSDTEVLLVAYQHWGVDCLAHFRGMFAFAIWDRRDRQLFLARDRCGEKPLIYYFDDEVFIFGSEFKAVVPLLPRLPALDPAAVDMYLHFQYTPEPFTLLQGVHKLESGHFALLSTTDWSMRTETYWDIQSIPADPSITEQDIRDEIETAVRMTLRSDVTVAVALSAGIDSGLIAALAAKNSPEPIHTFSVGYPGRPSYDERDRAKALAQELGCIFHEVEIPTDQFVDIFPDFVGYMDEPIGDIAAFGHFSVPKAAADNGIKVLLSGIGGDELFWGYDSVRWAVELNQRLRFYKFNAALFKPFLKSAYFRKQMSRAARTRKLGDRSRTYFRKIMAVANGTTPDDQLVLHAVSTGAEFTKDMMIGSGWYGPAMDNVTGATAFTASGLKRPHSRKDIPGAIQKLMFKMWLVSNSINLGDRVSMAVGVEIRMPLLDHRLIEMVVARQKVHPDYHLGQKTMLRKILRDVLPPDVLSRPKAGFVPPVMEWLKGVIGVYGGQLHGGHLVSQGILRPEAVGPLLRLQQANAHVHTVYRLVLLETWYALMTECARLRSPAAITA